MGEETFDFIAQMTACHRSQIEEWLPWVGRHKMPPPKSFDEWRKILRDRFDRKNRQLGIKSDRAFETYTVTAWGVVPPLEQLLTDFPAINRQFSNLDRLKERLERWSHG